MSRLLGLSIKEITKNRVKAAKELQNKFSCHVLFKGSETILVDTKKNVFVSNHGTLALAKAGTGDVLTGIITAMLAQGLSSLEAMKVSTVIHGRASQLYLKKGNDYLGMRPTDLIENIPKAIKNLR